MVDVAMEIVTLHDGDGVMRQKHILRGRRVALIQDCRDGVDRVVAYVDSGERDAVGRRVMRESDRRMERCA